MLDESSNLHKLTKPNQGVMITLVKRKMADNPG